MAATSTNKTQFDRRQLLCALPAAMAFLAAHDAWAETSAGLAAEPASRKIDPLGRPLLSELRLLTAVPLEAMRRFYAETIGFRVLASRADQISFAAGQTLLTFVRARPDQIHGDGGRGDGKPFYHFAFNIPQNKIKAARAWQLQRTALVPPPEDLQDPAFPKDVWHFRNWNAHSIFFFDPAFNIVEYIARHDLRNDHADPTRFAVEDLLYASEIGFVLDRDEQKSVVATIERQLGLHEYPRGSSPKWALGDEHGLLLCLGRKNEIWGENTSTPVKWAVFPTEAKIHRSMARPLELGGLPYRVLG